MTRLSCGLLRAFGLALVALALAVPGTGATEKKEAGGKKKGDAGLVPGDEGGDPGPAPKTYEPPAGARPYEASARPTDGKYLQASIRKLSNAKGDSKPFVFHMIGSSYTNRLGQGEEFKALIREKFPKAPDITVKRFLQMGTPYGGFKDRAQESAAEKPDLVLIYTFGAPSDLEELLKTLRAGCDADIIVPSVHWTSKEKSAWDAGHEPAGIGSPGVEKGMSTNWDVVRPICEKYKAEFVDSRNEIAEWMRANKVQPGDLLADAVHQKPYLAHMIRMNVVRHLNPDFTGESTPPVPANPPDGKPPAPPPVPPPANPPTNPPTNPPANPPAPPANLPASPPPAPPANP
ncbi:MAG: SGNH/GDSL hydrolase family protein [Planctomycetota bacterium]